MTREFLDGDKLMEYPEDVLEDHILRWMQALYARELSHRTVCNYYTSLTTFLKFWGIDNKELMGKEGRPTFSDPDPEAKFFFAINNQRDSLGHEGSL